jgi:hypothetical protein
MRTYTFKVGKIAEAIGLYENDAAPVLKRYEKNLVGYFTGDIGAMNQLIHIWKFDDDADRRDFWGRLLNDEEFKAFGAKLRPLILTQENKLMLASSWGPHP